MLANRTIITEKIREAFSSVLPISLIVFFLCVTFTPIESGTLVAFMIGAVCVIAGMGIFTLGAETAMTPIGEYIGSSVMKTKRLWLISFICFFVGLLITISEPDLHVLATQLDGSIDYWTLIIAVGIGVGVFLVIAFLRMVLKIKLSYLLIGCYVTVFVLAIFTPANFSGYPRRATCTQIYTGFSVSPDPYSPTKPWEGCSSVIAFTF